MKIERIKQLLDKGWYSMWLGKQCERPKNDLVNEQKEYQAILKSISQDFQKRKEQLEYVNSQISSIQYALDEYERKELSDIEPTEDHKKLIKELNFVEYKNGGDYVYIGVDGKRPFGNSDIMQDVAEILKWKLPNDDLSEKQYEKAKQLLKELPYALNNLIKNIK